MKCYKNDSLNDCYGLSFLINPLKVNNNISYVGAYGSFDEYELLDSNNIIQKSLYIERDNIKLSVCLLYDASTFKKKEFVCGIFYHDENPFYIYGNVILVLKGHKIGICSIYDKSIDYEKFVRDTFILFNDTKHDFLLNKNKNDDGNDVTYIRGFCSDW